MVVSKISSEKSVPFGMKYNQQEMSRKMFGDVIVARQTRDIVELSNGKTVVIGTHYQNGKVVHKVLTLWDEANNWTKAVIKEWFSGAKRPSVHVLDEKTIKNM